jgi:hypothetical protein
MTVCTNILVFIPRFLTEDKALFNFFNLINGKIKALVKNVNNSIS